VITVVLPAYNEEAALPPLLDSLARLREERLPDLHVLVVDDGSKDATAAVVRGRITPGDWLRLVPHPHNMGLSQAIQTGFEAALEGAQPDDLLITMDADNTHPPDLIPGMLAKLAEGYDVVIASRYRPGAKVHGVPPHRQLFSVGMRLLFQLVLPIKGVRDYSCGYRAYRAEVLQRAYAHYGESFITEQGFSCMVEILCQLNRLQQVRFAEVPLILHYDRKPSATKMRVTRTITDTLRLLWRYRFGE
jgi:dolichol-phosphate mannosyltransferase